MGAGPAASSRCWSSVCGQRPRRRERPPPWCRRRENACRRFRELGRAGPRSRSLGCHPPHRRFGDRYRDFHHHRRHRPGSPARGNDSVGVDIGRFSDPGRGPHLRRARGVVSPRRWHVPLSERGLRNVLGFPLWLGLFPGHHVGRHRRRGCRIRRVPRQLRPPVLDPQHSLFVADRRMDLVGVRWTGRRGAGDSGPHGSQPHRPARGCGGPEFSGGVQNRFHCRVRGVGDLR